MQGTILGQRYGITRHLSTGRFSQTYLAEDLSLPGNPRRILLQLNLRSRHPQLVKYARYLFKKETRILAEVGEYPQIPELYDRFERDGSFYLIQDYIDGDRLANTLQGRPLDEESTVLLLQEILPILAFIHQHQLIHRAINPNSFLRRRKDNQLVLVDFGNVQQISTLDLNPAGKIGIRGAIAPSGYAPQFSQGKPDPSYDVYAVGILAIQALTGLSPNALPRDQNGRLSWRDRLTISDRFAEFLASSIAEEGDRRYANATEALQWLNATSLTTANAIDRSTTLTFTPTLPISQNPLPIPQTQLPREDLLCGRYRLLESLGEGGFGYTFLARDEQFPGMPQCVVKHLQPYRKTPNILDLARRLFDNEAKVLSQLGQHPQIPRLLAHFEENNEFYLVQEYIPGHDLQQELIPGQSLPESAVVAFLQDILEILVFVHQTNVIHRDIKPANIRRREEDGKLVLIDFGAVKQIEERLDKEGMSSNLTVGIGTPGYIPSEQAQGKPKFSSDVYSVGIVAIEALTGIDPERLADDPQTGELIWRDRAHVSPDLAQIIDRMVRYDFRQRYDSAAEALEAIAHLLHRPTRPLPGQYFTLAQFSGRSRQFMLGVGVMGTIALALFLAGRKHQPVPILPNNTEVPQVISPLEPRDLESNTSPEASLAELSGEAIPLNFEAIDAEYHPTLNKIAIAVNNPPRLIVYSPFSRRQQEIPLDYPPLGVSLGPKGEFAAIGHDRHVSWVDLRQGRIMKTLPIAVDIFDLVLANKGWVYISPQRDRRLWAIDGETGEATQTPDDNTQDFSQTYFALHPGGKAIFGIIGRSQTPKIQQIDITQNDPRPTVQLQTIAGDFSRSGYLWFDLEKRRVLTDNGSIFTLIFNQNTREINVRQLNVAANSERGEISRGRVAFSSLDQKIIVLDRNSGTNSLAFDRLSIFDYQTLQLQKSLLLPTVRINGETQRLTGQFVFANTRNNEYYILAQSPSSTNPKFYLIVCRGLVSKPS
ncbi:MULTISPECIES: serine/threonine-protein kinase [Spirulina sp. CCY15215]|uniref:serine/threonine-protein kinase n=1 Tax=Spirulina sp. CCY15215 TaxID=2767591 RepID=UPI001950CB9D|nr:serine/threonine-protein kinase [Spirulina major]